MSKDGDSLPGPGSPARLSNLQVRTISSVVLIVAVLGLTWFGGPAFTVLSAAISAAIFYEWTSMSPADARHRLIAWGMLGAVLLVLLAAAGPAPVFGAAAIAVVLVALDARIRKQGYETTAGLAYAALSGISLALLRGDNQGLAAILFLFAIVWATDIMAYFVGRTMGGPKLAPAISPGKTWSGAIGGAAGGVLAGVAAALVTGYAGVGAAALVALILSIVSQLGDLFESWIKRRHGVKDSSNLIPGHGGVMDRVDGLVVAAFALYLIGAILGGVERSVDGVLPL